MSWFRIHTTMLHHAVIQGLPAATFKFWLNLLCLAKDGDGTIPEVETVAFQCRCGLVQAQRLTNELVEDYGLLERNEDGTFHPHNWEKHQYKSDNGAERVRAFRERQRNVTVTPSEYRVQSTDTEQSQIQKVLTPLSPKNGSSQTHGSRFAFEEIPDEWVQFCGKMCWPLDRINSTFEQFGDYWRAVAGAKGRKADWLATWRGWCRRENEKPPGRGNGSLFHHPARESHTDRIIRVVQERINRGERPI